MPNSLQYHSHCRLLPASLSTARHPSPSVSLHSPTCTKIGASLSVPAGPGFVGNYQVACTAALGLYGVPAAEGLAVSIVHHALNFLIVGAMSGG